MESGIHPSLHPNCHHQIIYAKFKLKVYYPPPYEREVWHYQNADSNANKKSNDRFFLGRGIWKPFCWWKSFNKTIKNILSNYVPHEIITIDDRDPPWFNKNVKSLIEILKHGGFMFEVIKIYSFFEKFTSLQIQLSDLIETRKQNYHFRLLRNLEIETLVQRLTGHYSKYF